MLPSFLRTGIAAVALVMTVPAVAQAPQIGSGVVPREQGNSAHRPIDFAASAPADAALVIMTASAALPESAPLSPSEMSEVEAEITAREFAGKAGEKLVLRGIGARPAVVVVGTGTAASGTMEAAGTAARELIKERAPVALVGVSSAEAAADAALGYALGQYRFDRYRTGATEPPVQPVTVVAADVAAARAAHAAKHSGTAEGVRFARDVISEPANVIYPESFIERTRAAFNGLRNVQIEVLDEAAMRRLGMGALVGVGQGSRRGSRLLLVTYQGVDGPPLALVGKGITFDSGGISLKPGNGMHDMKADMSGAAAVVGAALSLARTQAPVHVVAVAALAENMPGGNAQRPGDVVRTYSGKTIEVINTDAEGRLVLSDAIGYVADKRKPFAIVDIATLTGAAINALGPEYAGLFARDDAVAARVEAAAEKTGEAVWRLPLHPTYRKAVQSSIADVKNSGNAPAPGASAGAHFIEAFVAEDMPWAHIDMAPTMWANKDGPLTPVGATGYGVRLLDELARKWQP
jgi:leucyl aminopeptidase